MNISSEIRSMMKRIKQARRRKERESLPDEMREAAVYYSQNGHFPPKTRPEVLEEIAICQACADAVDASIPHGEPVQQPKPITFTIGEA